MIVTIVIVVSDYDCGLVAIIMKIRLLNIHVDVNEVNNCFSHLILGYRSHSIKQLADYSDLFSIYYLSV